MSDRTRNEKTFAQDAAGFLLILLGGFGAVSIVLHLRGQQPAENAIRGATWPVVELVTLLGSPAALVFCAALAGLGTLLFLRSTVLAPGRPIAGLTAVAVGLALILGAVGSGGEVGAWLPGLLAGFAGRALGAVLGLALAWLGWILLFSPRHPRATSAETVQRIGLAARHDAAAGVSPAEAALLVTEPRAPAPAPRREEARPLRIETVRPFPAAKEAPAAPRARRGEASAMPLVTPVRAPATAPATPPASVPPESTLAPLTPPVPSWELAGGGADEEDADEPQARADLAPERAEEGQADGAEDGDEENDPFEALSEDVVEEFEAEEVAPAALGREADVAPALRAEAGAEENDEEDDEEDELEDEPAAAPAPSPSWEQIGLFDDQEEEEAEEPAPAAAPRAELTPAFDFDSAEPRKPAHEPEASEDPFAAEPALVESAELLRELREEDAQAEALDDEELAEPEPPQEKAVELAPARPPAPKASVPPAAAPAAKAAPAAEPERVEREPEARSWDEIVFESGLAILEQKRVAVSMLERRFGIDFDQACRVLDELQQAGLIGPYMGGRTRDILLTREEWLAHAPHAS